MNRKFARSISCLCSGAIALTIAQGADAQTGSPIDSNNYAIDLHQGPISSGAGRVVGLAGAFTAMVDGIDGLAWNPAAFAARDRDSMSFVRFDPTISFHHVLTGDYWNTGDSNTPSNDFFVGNVGALLQIGPVGFGDLLEMQTYVVGADPARQLSVISLNNHVGGGFMLFGGQLALGGAYRYSQFTIQPAGAFRGAYDPTSRNLVEYGGHGFELGITWRPVVAPIRLGAAFYSESVGSHAPTTSYGGVQRAGVCDVTGSGNLCFALPDRVVTPWRVDLGFAFQVGTRMFNVRWEDPTDDPDDQRLAARLSRRDRFTHRPRGYFLMSFDLQIHGPTPNGEGMDAFLTQTSHPSGRNVTVSPRLGIETEAVPNHFKLRIGSYFEPSRYLSSSWRYHFTGGFDLKLFTTTFGDRVEPVAFQLSANIDVAERYFHWGISFGVWI